MDVVEDDDRRSARRQRSDDRLDGRPMIERRTAGRTWPVARDGRLVEAEDASPADVRARHMAEPGVATPGVARDAAEPSPGASTG